MGGILTKLLSGGAGDLVNAVGDAADKLFTSDEEKAAMSLETRKAEFQHAQALADIELKGHVAEMADTADARMNQSRVQESASASWLSKNVHPILAFMIMGIMFAMFWFIIFRETPSANRDLVMLVIGSVTTIGSQVASYFFGSSSGSAEKNRLLGGDKK